jgi:hypothetical protein
MELQESFQEPQIESRDWKNACRTCLKELAGQQDATVEFSSFENLLFLTFQTKKQTRVNKERKFGII